MFNKLWKAVLFGFGGLLAVQNAQALDQLKIGYVYISPIGDAGWTFQHEKGRQEMIKALGDKVSSHDVENVPEGPDAERVIREMVNSGDQLIFATSFGYMNSMEKVSKAFPKVIFQHATGYKSGANFDHYNARFYEGRYVNGVVAGKMTKSNVLGVVAAFPIPEVLMGINAFTRGALSVNPKVKVKVIWVNSWFDPGKERAAAMTLISQGADVLTHHTDSTAVLQVAEEKGVYGFAYHSDMSKYAPKAQLSATIHEWGNFYTQVAKSVLAGNWKKTSIWGGYKEGMIRTAPLNAIVPKEVKEEVAKLEDSLKKGTFHPFSGPVVDQSGKERVAKGQTISDQDLSQMNYYVQGVESQLPKN